MGEVVPRKAFMRYQSCEGPMKLGGSQRGRAPATANHITAAHTKVLSSDV